MCAQAAWVARTQPDLASERLASQLADLGESGRMEGGQRLAADMLGRLGRHEQQARLLLQAGLPLHALAIVRHHRLVDMDPTPFLHAVARTGEPSVQACHKSPLLPLPFARHRSSANLGLHVCILFHTHNKM